MFFAKKGVCSQVKSSESKSNLAHISSTTSGIYRICRICRICRIFRICTGFGPTICRCWAFRCQMSFFFISKRFFKFAFHFLEKRWVWFPGAEFNSESIGISFKSKIGKSKNLVWHFLFPLFRFWAILIKFDFLNFFGRSGTPGNSTPLAQSRKISRIWGGGGGITRLPT